MALMASTILAGAYLALGNYYRHLGLGMTTCRPRIREMASRA